MNNKDKKDYKKYYKLMELLAFKDVQEEFCEDETIFMDCDKLINTVCKKKLDAIIARVIDRKENENDKV